MHARSALDCHSLIILFAYAFMCHFTSVITDSCNSFSGHVTDFQGCEEISSYRLIANLLHSMLVKDY